MTTQRQIDANRKNSEKSSGPRTPSGKEASRRNAITHGLTSLSLLPDDLEEAVAENLAVFTASYSPQTLLDHFYVEQAARELARIKQGQVLEHIATLKQCQRATSDECWHRDRVLEAVQLLDKLPKKPEVFIRRAREHHSRM